MQVFGGRASVSGSLSQPVRVPESRWLGHQPLLQEESARRARLPGQGRMHRHEAGPFLRLSGFLRHGPLGGWGERCHLCLQARERLLLGDSDHTSRPPLCQSSPTSLVLPVRPSLSGFRDLVGRNRREEHRAEADDREQSWEHRLYLQDLGTRGLSGG